VALKEGSLADKVPDLDALTTISPKINADHWVDADIIRMKMIDISLDNSHLKDYLIYKVILLNNLRTLMKAILSRCKSRE
jgi:hypothetical protein